MAFLKVNISKNTAILVKYILKKQEKKERKKHIDLKSNIFVIMVNTYVLIGFCLNNCC